MEHHMEKNMQRTVSGRKVENRHGNFDELGSELC